LGSSLQGIISEIEKIKKLDLKRDDITIEDIKIRIGEMLSSVYLIKMVGAQFPTVYRARPNEGTSLFQNIEQVWYPPRDKVKKLGRFNNIGESMFYCSATYNPCIFECHPKKGDWITLLECEAIDRNKKIAVADAFFHKFKSAEGQIIFDKSYDIIQKQGREIIRKKGLEKEHNEIQKFIEKEALKIVKAGEEYKYKITVAIKEIFFTVPIAQGITYPSLATGMENINFALKPQVADEYYRPKIVRVLKVIGEEEQEYVLELVNISESINFNTGEIIYKY
jgi:hypothetical protein